MKRPVRAQLSVLAGVFGFFAGGLINSGKELVDIMLGAAIGWGLVFFAVYIILAGFYRDAGENSADEKGLTEKRAEIKAEKNKGKKIDIIVKSEDSLENIYKLK